MLPKYLVYYTTVRETIPYAKGASTQGSEEYSANNQGMCALKTKKKNEQSNLVDKEGFDKEQIGVKEPFPVTNCQFTS